MRLTATLEAIQFLDIDEEAIPAFSEPVPKWLNDAMDAGRVYSSGEVLVYEDSTNMAWEVLSKDWLVWNPLKQTITYVYDSAFQSLFEV